ncbi:branched-chain amino acid ABC transporter permease [Halomarina oriensis]|uniref:Branched-chain amino acid ABC transporter permease n=1 Tax=Halomarina oriensis TaxID=671145 RepID=A0A6B0GXB9_9EURY|nr:branched-chain amino acid ABC transporter permease [Halomarina oriensis]MWG36785.1 branched-chain amino acid ABC transporter permease [Halomarina oriensis]
MSDETRRADDTGTVDETGTGLAGGDLLTRWRSVKERESFVILGTVVAVLLFPYLFARAPVVSEILQGYQSLAELMLIWGIFVIGFDLLHGYTGLLSFGHAAFWGGGAYAAGVFAIHVSGSPIAMILVGTTFAVLLAWVLGFLSLRRGGIYFAILTLAFAQMLFYVALQPLSNLTGGDNGLGIGGSTIEPLLGFIPLDAGVPVITMFVDTWMYMLIGIAMVVTVAFAYRVLNSPYGMVFRAIRENEQRAEFVGLNVWRYKLMSFVLSGAIAGLAGSLFAIQQARVPVESLFWTTSGEVVIMSVIGGVGSLFGGPIGAALYLYISNIVQGMSEVVLFTQIDKLFPGAQAVVLPEWASPAPYWHLILGLLFVLVVVFIPRGGIWGGLQSIGSRIGSRFGGDR